MTAQTNISHAAKVLVRKFGEGAPWYAAVRADNWRDAGDLEAHGLWRQIARASEALLSRHDRRGRRLHGEPDPRLGRPSPPGRAIRTADDAGAATTPTRSLRALRCFGGS